MDTCLCMAESLCCSETITLLRGYIPTQNKKLQKKKVSQTGRLSYYYIILSLTVLEAGS